MTKYFDAEGWRLAYDDVGEGEPIVLLHGFAADRRLNWKLPGWYDVLVNAGYRVLALDARGHGQSARPSDVEAYRPAGIAGDAIRLLDHLGLRKACLFGYSMGGRNAAWLLAHHGRRFRAVVIGGTGLNLLAPAEARRWAKRGFALTRDNANTESLAIPAMVPLYRRALQRGGRTGALAGCLMGAFPNMGKADFARVKTPALVACGSKDTLAGSPIPLAASIPGARRAGARAQSPERGRRPVLQGRGARIPRLAPLSGLRAAHPARRSRSTHHSPRTSARHSGNTRSRASSSTLATMLVPAAR